MTRKTGAGRSQNLFPRQPHDGFRAEAARLQAAADAKTARLRALRLAKEEADRAARLEFEAAHPPAAKTRKRICP